MITIYTQNRCSFCVRAKSYLNTLGIEYTESNIGTDPEARKFIMSEGHRTVPQIYNDGKLLVPGGYDGLSKLTKENIMERINK